MPEQRAAKPAAVSDQLTGAAGDGKLEPIEIETAGRHQQSDIVDADVVDADVVDVDVVDAEVLESPTVAAPLKRIGRRSGLVLPDPQTDEWPQTQGADAPAALPPSQSPPAPTPPAQAHGAGVIEVPVARPEPAASAPAADWAPTATSPGTEVEVLPRADLVRPGPSILEADTWTVDPDDTPNSDYHGRRRADTTGRRRLLVAAALALIFVTGTIGVALLLNSGSTPEATGPGGSTSSTDDPLYSDAPVTTTEGELGPASSSPGASLTASPKPTTAATTTAPVVPVVTTPPATPAPTSTPFELAYEAEAVPPGNRPNTVVSEVAGASGGRVVDEIGEWPGPDGRIDFAVGPIPSAGTYTITVHYVFAQRSDDSVRRFWARVNGVTREDYMQVDRVTTCPCGTVSFTATLGSGSNTIRFFTYDGLRAPAIDRIVISQP